MGQARYDLDTARIMFDTGRYLYVLFCCQQALEKGLKGMILYRSKGFPPRIHNLPRLAEVAGIDLDKERQQTYAELSALYIQTRYPEEIESLGKRVSREAAWKWFQTTEREIAWLLSMIP